MTIEAYNCECGCQARYRWRGERVCRSCWEDLTSLEDEAIRHQVLEPWSALQRAVWSGRIPGDDYLWLGSIAIPITWQAWRDLLRPRRPAL